MLRYVLRRLGQALILLVGISIISFAIIHFAPGDPIRLLADRNAPPHEIARIRQLYGLDDPVHVQYWRWVTKAVRGDLGNSLISGQPVVDMIMERMPNTLILNLIVAIIIYGLSIPIGVISAMKQYSWFDHLVTTFSFIGRCMPNFFFAMLLIYFIAIPIEWVPISGMSTYGVNWSSSSVLEVIVDRLRYLILPTIVLAFGGMAGTVRFMRAQMLEVKKQDYVRTARAKGLAERVVVYTHAMRNALLPIVTMVGFEIPILFSGAFIIEVIFSWPGVGMVAMRAITNRDYPVIMAFNTMGAALMVIGNFVADMLYVVVDPRIKYD